MMDIKAAREKIAFHIYIETTTVVSQNGRYMKI
jgi:hypothetical protein